MYFSKQFNQPDLGKRARQMQVALSRLLKKAGYEIDLIMTIWGVLNSAPGSRVDIQTTFGWIIIWNDHFAIEGLEI